MNLNFNFGIIYMNLSCVWYKSRQNFQFQPKLNVKEFVPSPIKLGLEIFK